MYANAAHKFKKLVKTSKCVIIQDYFLNSSQTYIISQNWQKSYFCTIKQINKLSNTRPIA